MFSHVMVGSNDIERSERFYDALLAVIGAGKAMRNEVGSGHVRMFYPHDGGMFSVSQPINSQSATSANGGTVGFKCTSPEQVQEFHDVAVANGGTSIEGPPGLREGSLGAMHLAYVRDPDGNKLCALYRASAFAAQGLQIAAGTPLACDEPADFKTFRLGLFGLDKLKDVDGTVQRLHDALARILA